MATYNIKIVQINSSTWVAFPSGQQYLVATRSSRQAAIDALTDYLRNMENASVSCTTEESTTTTT